MVRGFLATVTGDEPAGSGVLTPVSHTVCDIASRNRFHIGFGAPAPLRMVAMTSISSQ